MSSRHLEPERGAPHLVVTLDLSSGELSTLYLVPGQQNMLYDMSPKGSDVEDRTCPHCQKKHFLLSV